MHMNPINRHWLERPVDQVEFGLKFRPLRDGILWPSSIKWKFSANPYCIEFWSYEVERATRMVSITWSLNACVSYGCVDVMWRTFKQRDTNIPGQACIGRCFLMNLIYIQFNKTDPRKVMVCWELVLALQSKCPSAYVSSQTLRVLGFLKIRAGSPTR